MTPRQRQEAEAAYRDLAAQADDLHDDEEGSNFAARLHTMAARVLAGQWSPYPWQHPHAHGEDGFPLCDEDCLTRPDVEVPMLGMWLQLGGRGTGKTEGAARYVNAHVEGPPCDTRLPGGHRLLMIAPTQGDGADAVTGPSGLSVVNPAVRLTGGWQGLAARWTSGPGAGTRMRVLGAHAPDDIERLRVGSGNTCLVWVEELAAIRRLDEALEISEFGLRLGRRPHYVGSTTPKPRPKVRELVERDDVIVTRGRTEDATHLDPVLRDKYLRRYGGTRLGRQELGGEILGDVEGALWVHDETLTGLLENGQPDDRPGIEQMRVAPGSVGWSSHRPDAPAILAPIMCHRVIVAVDPPGGTAEAGIQVLGEAGGHGYLIADLSGQMGPNAWAQRAIDAYYDFGAEGVAVETAYGGDMVVNTIRTLDPQVPIFKVPTKVGKRLRAEPVQAVAQQHRLHLVGSFPETESQMTGWVPDETPESPDRLDALVHAATYLLIRAVASTLGSPLGKTIRRPPQRPR